MSQTVATILLALAVPVGWGLLSAWLFDRWRDWRRRGRERHAERAPEGAR